MPSLLLLLWLTVAPPAVPASPRWARSPAAGAASALPAVLADSTRHDSAGLRALPPDSVGMSAERLASIDRVMSHAVEAEGFPGAAVVVGHRGAIVWKQGYGTLDWPASSRAVNPDATFYDLASLTKVVATTTAIMVLYDRHRLRLDDRVSRYLPAFSGGLKSRVTIRDLLTHRSGLPQGRELWRSAHSPAEARRQVLHTPLECAPGECEIYSDLGFDVLGMVVEAISGERLDHFLTRTVYRPLGMRHTMFRPPAALRGHAAPTEIDPPRGHPLRGEVHDENAYALGGVAGHAGLFATAGDLAVFAQMMLDGGRYRGVRIVSDSTVALFTRRTAGWRALGWESCAGGGSCGQYMSERAYGHTGYTGTSIWIDPDRQSFVIVLTNWVHGRPNEPVAPSGIVADVRADVADIAALAVMDDPSGIPEMPTELRADRAIRWTRSGP